MFKAAFTLSWGLLRIGEIALSKGKMCNIIGRWGPFIF
jgi:hypothetical protein